MENVRIPVGSAHLNLVGKALCRRHRNKLIVNAAKRQKTAEQMNKSVHTQITGSIQYLHQRILN